MGRGNVCVTGDYEGLYYVDNDYIHSYYRVGCDPDEEESALLGELDYSDLSSGDWVFDEWETNANYKWFLEWFQSSFMKKFASFSECDKWIGHRRETHAILENRLFYIAVEDNQWSTAVMLLEKEDPLDASFEGLKSKHYSRYLNGIKNALFEQFEKLGTYGGAWTSGTIKKPVS